ncbi:MAG: glycosyltransferase family 1 protein [Patescibacteria group bacterium]
MTQPKKMRLLIDVRALMDRSSGGVARVALELMKNFAVQYPEVELVCATTGFGKRPLPHELSKLDNIKHIHLNIPNKLWGILSFLNVVSFSNEIEKQTGKIDATFFPNLGFMGSCRDHGYFLLLHDLSFLIEPRWFSRKQRIWHDLVKAKKMIYDAKHLLAVSETTKRDAVRLLGIPENHITVIPLGPTSVVGAGSPRQGSIKNRYVLSIGAGDPRKNSATAIQAVKILRREIGYDDLEMVLIGRPQAVRGTWHKKNWIHTLERPSDSELANLYANASAFLYPSWYEGYGLPLHEAASFGTPCIASTSGALPETAPPGTIFANPAKPHHWVEAIKIALIKRNEPIQIDVQTWQKSAELMKETMKL